ncbi:hypothetical protein, conserved [Trypanosoma brucei gambiense DAL972]|uniref:RNA-editing substrate-binding complex 6 protein domain-containing protein n=1 Tax=Trypanosoma brucei gambiense (strain MHOM/CI/86/DAL972) TaxID=679716 RepID=D0A7T7_TRYB9|nr:hypothetical protein, conserved [Trypanosoma brucei gambiense DAL972]CBH17738.1 hypothetical protein, conserved [Trypanosoma brucei gambiense DAL972]|eukprot:XP_011780002.1 hypothetical protein, conserved [Trypanosoma brucei gambiense DAL972]
MNGRLYCLIRRITSPPVATRLIKEELCLSMAAIARLPLRRDQLAHLTNTEAITTRAQRISHLCTPTELGMIAEGAEALSCNRFDLADALIDGAYESVRRAASSTRLSHVSAIARYSASIKTYGNETITTLLKAGASLLQKNDSVPVLKSFLGVAQSHLTDGEMRMLIDEMCAKATEEQRLCINSIGTQSLAKAAAKCGEETLTKGNEDGDETAVGDEETQAWDMLRARQWMLQLVRCGKPPTAAEAVQAMELYAHFTVRDFVLHEKIEDLVLLVLPTGNKFHLNEMHKIVLRSPNLFPRVRNTLGQDHSGVSDVHRADRGVEWSDDPASSLTTTYTTSRAYSMLLLGQRLPEDIMFDVVQEQSETIPVDVAAQAACLFAEKGDIPEGVILRLSAELEHISPQGVTAFVRAARRDSSGALLPHYAAVLNRFTERDLCDTPLETLLQMCEVFALPAPRGTSEGDNDSINESQSKFQKALIVRLFSVIQGSRDVPFLCKVAKAVRAFDANDELIQFVCSSICAQGALSECEALIAFDMIRCCDFVYEPLLDAMEPVFRRLVESVSAMLEGKSTINDVEVRRCACFATLQSEFDCPDFETLASLLVHTVEKNVTGCPVELIPSVGLLCVRTRRTSALYIVGNKLEGNMQQLSDDAIGELARLLVGTENLATKELAVEFQSVVVSRLLRQQSLPPDVVALSAVVWLRQGDKVGTIDERSVDYIIKWMYAIGSSVYTDLCLAVHLSASVESLSNALIDDLPRRLELLTTNEMANAIFGLGEVSDVGARLSHQLVAERCSDYVVDHSQEFWSGKVIARLLYGFSRMHCTKRSLYNVFATRLAHRPVFSLLDQEAISFAIAAFGRVKYLDKKLFDRFTRWILDHSKDLNAAELLLTIRGVSRVMLLNDQLYDDLGSKAAEKVKEFPIESQCVLLSSFGSLGVEHERLASRMVSSIAENREELTDATKAVDVITSLWSMNYDVEDDKHVAQLADWVVQRAEELTDESIGKLCLVLSDTNWRHVPLVRAIAEQSVRLQGQQSISPKCCREVLDVLGTFMIHHQGARENLSALGRSISKERIQLSEEEEQHLQLLLRR